MREKSAWRVLYYSMDKEKRQLSMYNFNKKKQRGSSQCNTNFILYQKFHVSEMKYYEINMNEMKLN